MNFEIQDYKNFGLDYDGDDDDKEYKRFFIISLFTLFISAFLGFYFLEKPLSLWSWDDPWLHFIPISIALVWTGIVFLWISPVQRALEIIGLGILGVFAWHRLFSWLVTKKYFDFNFPIFSLRQGLQVVIGVVVLALCVLMLTGIISFIILMKRKG